MVKRAKKAHSAAKMYRHFAVVTVIITAAVAIMADPGSGENVDEAIETAQDYSQQQKQQFTEASTEKFGTGALIDNSDSREIEGEFGSDSWVGYAGAGRSSSRPRRQTVASETPWVLLGMTRAEFEALSPEKQDELLANLQADTLDNATMARISGQSMRRAGRSEPSDDAPY